MSIPTLSMTSPSEQHKTIPPELIDQIIDHLHLDSKALSTCSLVCRAWLPSTRHHLFRSLDVKVQREALITFQSLLDSPRVTFLDAISCLKIIGVKWKIDAETRNAWFPVVARLSRLKYVYSVQVERLSWEDLDLHCCSDRGKPASILLGFPNLRVLDISFVRARSFSSIFRVVSACEQLTSLSIVDVMWDPDYTREVATYQTPRLSQLTLTRCRKQDVLDWLVAGGRFAPETSVRFEAIRPTERGSIGRYVEVLQGSLTELSLEFNHRKDLRWECNELVYGIDEEFTPTLSEAEASWKRPDLKCNIRQLFIDKMIDSGEGEGTALKNLPDLLSHLSPCSIHRIECAIRAGDLDELDSFDWPGLDVALSEKRRQKTLAEVVFWIRIRQTAGQVIDLENEIRRRIPKCEEENLTIIISNW